MELDLEPITIWLTVGLYIVVVICIWAFKAFMFTWDMPVKTKIYLSVIMLPMTYFMVVLQKNR